MEQEFSKKFASEFIDKVWEASMRQSLEDFIGIPNVSKNFDSEWETNGLLDVKIKINIIYYKNIFYYISNKNTNNFI